MPALPRLLSAPTRPPWEPVSSRPDRQRRVLPFGAVLLLAVAVAALPPGDPGRFVGLGLAGLGFTLTAALIVVVPWERLPDWPRLVPVVAFCTFVAVTRHSTGGSRSGFAFMLVLAVVWQAVYGTRPQMGLTVALVFATIAGPALLLDESDYPQSEWRKALLLALVSVVVGVVVQELVRQVRRERWVVGQLAGMARVAAGDRARAELCAAAQRITGADMAVLVEPTADGVRVAASSGVELPVVELQDDLVPPVIHRALRSGQLQVVLDTEADDESRGGVSTALGMRAWAHQPAATASGDLIDLAVAWRTPQRRLSPLAAVALPLVGPTVAAAVDRTDLVARLEAMAHQDPLTGLPNRRAWDDVLKRELARAARTGRPLSVAVVDLDRFKAFNDAHGHLVGDRLLEGVAVSWVAALRASDVLARWGGEEFAVLMPETDAEEAEGVLGRVAAATPMGQTFSAGLVTTVADVGPSTLMAAADAAVYRAKEAGRDRVARGRVATPYASSRSV